MNIFRNHNNGRIEQLKTQKKKLEKIEFPTKEDERKLDKVNYELGFRRSKEKQYEEKATRSVSKNTTNNTSIHNEANGVKNVVEEANLMKKTVNKFKKSSKSKK